MGLWRHGVEKILPEAGMQNEETEIKTFARYMSTEVRKGAMCSPSRKPEKRGHTFNRFIRRARKRVTENRDSFNGSFHGLRSANGRVKEITSRRRCEPVMKNGANSTGRRQQAEKDSFSAFCS